jgi:hypothetical protein
MTKYVAQPSSAASSSTVPVRPSPKWRRDARHDSQARTPALRKCSAGGVKGVRCTQLLGISMSSWFVTIMEILRTATCSACLSDHEKFILGFL